MRVQARDANHIEELQACVTRSGSDARALAYLGYALAKELDDVQRCDEAFHWFVESAKARRSLMRYDVAGDEGKVRRIAEVFTRDTTTTMPAVVAARDGGARCIFIVGLPRSGTTLVERLLSGLPDVRSNDETDNVSRALTTAARGTGDMFERAAAADPLKVAATYARLARVGDGLHSSPTKLPTLTRLRYTQISWCRKIDR